MAKKKNKNLKSTAFKKVNKVTSKLKKALEDTNRKPASWFGNKTAKVSDLPKVKVAPRVAIGNPAVTEENLGKALSFLTKKSKNKKSNKYKFLSVNLGVYPGAIVMHWAVEGTGFGEVAYHFRDGKVAIDTEGMSDDFVSQLQAEVLKQYKNQSLKITLSDNLLEKFLDRVSKEVLHNKKKE